MARKQGEVVSETRQTAFQQGFVWAALTVALGAGFGEWTAPAATIINPEFLENPCGMGPLDRELTDGLCRWVCHICFSFVGQTFRSLH